MELQDFYLEVGNLSLTDHPITDNPMNSRRFPMIDDRSNFRVPNDGRPVISISCRVIRKEFLEVLA